MFTPASLISNKQNQDLTEQRLKQLSLLSYKETIQKFHIEFAEDTKAPLGLNPRTAALRLESDGKNEITLTKKQTVTSRIIESLINPFNIVLFAIAIVSYVTDRITSGEADWVTISIILSMILISSLVSFIQSQRSSKAAAKLASMIANTAGVYRNGELIEIPMTDLVVGDVIRLSAGDMIPADIRFLSTRDTFVAQAALTGESNPVEKFARAHIDENDPLTDLKNLGFMGSNIVSGTATAVIIATGNNTYFGSMAKTLGNDKGKNSFERGVSSVSKLLIRMVIIMVPLVFLVNGFFKAEWSNSLLFAVSVAVGLTPEMLPVIMTSTLATGAVRMSRHKVIVKQLGAIQTFGEMDILCTDKTGTLTEDRIVLEKYMDVKGDDDPHILKYVYLNAFFQTGLRDLIDNAVINRAEQNGLTPITEDYLGVDEIPFDFVRRRLSVTLEEKKTTKRMLVTKGAVEEVLGVCSYVKLGRHIVRRRLNEKYREIAHATYEKYNAQGLRILAVAEKEVSKRQDDFDIQDETGLTLVGFVGFLDPPKATAKSALASLTKSGIKVVVLTGDSLGVATHVCDKVGIDPSGALTGTDVEAMDDAALKIALEDCSLLAKLSPTQKERVVRVLQDSGHTVGFLGDGINDAPPLHQADVGISVDTAVDIAKETASIILLKKDLTVLSEGVTEGRRTFGNISKYIKLAVSSNFGNMISVLVASIALPFLPMLPIHILTQNLLSDFSQLGLPLDDMDNDYLKKPRKWSPKSITSFMLFMGPLSSLFDIICFATLWFVFGYNGASEFTMRSFWAGWFIFGTISQILVIHVARTSKIPFIQSRPSLPLILSTFSIVAIACAIVFSPIAADFKMTTLTPAFLPFLIAILILYFLSVQTIKRIYKRRYKEWL